MKTDPGTKTPEVSPPLSSADPTVGTGTPAAKGEPYTAMFFQEFLHELRYSRIKEDVGTMAFGGFLLLLTAWCLLKSGSSPTWWIKGPVLLGLVALFIRVNDFLKENRTRQNQIKKVINATERTYTFPEDRAYIRFTDIKNLDGPGEWDKSEYSLADWDRSEYSLFLKVLGVAALLAVTVA